MHIQVHLQTAVGHESLTADVAEECFLAHRVGFLVRSQSSREFETLPADLTAVSTLARMRGFVSG